MARILVVDDEPGLARLVADWLTRDRHQVDVISDGSEALSELKAHRDKYELLILDIMLPGASGVDICKTYRSAMGTAPILMLTARDSIEDKERAFKLGADDYITKPFHLKELSVRVSALLRRKVLIETHLITVKDVVLDPLERTVTKAGQLVHLSPKEYSLLEFLMKHPNRLFSTEELIQCVWEPDSNAMNDTVRGHINRLRRKLDTEGHPSLISNVYGFGYRFGAEQ